MANEPLTGVMFYSKLGTPEMRTRLQAKMHEFNWRLGDSEQYRDYYISGKRTDGLRIEIQPENEPDEYYLAAYVGAMAVMPAREMELAMARQIHGDVLAIVEGVRKA